MSENDSKLKKIHDEKLIYSLLLTSKEKSEQILVWKFVGNKKITARVKISILNKINKTLSISSHEDDVEILSLILSSSESLNLYIPNGSSLFQSKIKNIESAHRVVLRIPQFVAQLERRKWLRLKTEDFSNIRIQFSKKIDPIKSTQQFYRKNLYDLGVGGLAIIMSKAEAKFFLNGETIKSVELLIDDHKIVADLEVVNQIELNPSTQSNHYYKVWKIGFKFAGMQKKDQELISSYIFKYLKSPIAV